MWTNHRINIRLEMSDDPSEVFKRFAINPLFRLCFVLKCVVRQTEVELDMGTDPY